MLPILICGLLAGGVVLLVILTYNKLVTLRNRFKGAFSQIDVQLKRRYDLIPNLVETVKGYMQFEQDTLQKVIDARSMAMASSVSPARISSSDLLRESMTASAGAVFFR